MKYKYPRFHLRKNDIQIGRVALAMLGLAVGAATAGEAVSNTEDGYLGELPVVLSVTRLAQTLEDTPGAVSIIDREMIRKSGAREVTDLLRFFVPGFVVSNRGNGANPTANYHAAIDTYGGGTHMQVFIDGRSVYSSLYVGDTHTGLMAVVLEDVERIEVLRGSNSAAYGANAFLGVINIITRNSVDTHGGMLSYTGGDRGISDNVARVGWGNADASFRLTAARREDSGTKPFREPAPATAYNQAYDDRTISQLHFRADMRPSLRDEVFFQAGSTTNSSGLGSGAHDNPWRNEETLATYAQARWTHELSPQESMSLIAQFDQEEHRDTVRDTTFYTGSSGESRRHNVEFQHTRQYGESVRAVMGGALRYEMVKGRQIFLTEESLSQNQKRLFGNIEWRPASSWIINAGGLYEDHSISGDTFSPRLMLNYHVTPEHTLRIGRTRANRTPTIAESRGKAYAFSNTTNQPLFATIVAKNQLAPETVRSQELGYFGNMRQWNLQADIRVFREEINDLITVRTTALPYYFENTGNLSTKGIEQQWKWHPFSTTQLLFNHTYTRITSVNPLYELRAPRISYSGALMQKLPGNLDLSVMYAHVQEMSFGSATQRLPAYGQIDIRLGYPFRLGSTKAEAAIVTQAINGNHYEHTNNVQVSRRAMGTLRLEF